jgi:hypothetical protein
METIKKSLSFMFIAAILFLAGCSFVGPGSVMRDRFDYTRAISDSWKSQMLVNMVGVRYGEAPVFLDVVNVINQYEMETQGNMSASWQSPLTAYNNINANTLGVGGSGRYTDRPTITYAPMSGEKFGASMLTPIMPSSIVGLVEAGFSVHFVLRLTVQSINGIQNRFGGSARARTADPRFYQLLDKWARLQRSGGIAYRVQKAKGEESLIITLRRNVSDEIEADVAGLKKLLALNPEKWEFKVVYGAVALNDDEIAILSRSLLQIMVDLGSYIEVPEIHVAEKRVDPTFTDQSVPGASVAPLIRVHSSSGRPSDVFVSVPYHDYWFWIDNKDLPSKQVFSFLMFVFTLTETGGKAGAPIVTIPTR